MNQVFPEYQIASTSTQQSINSHREASQAISPRINHQQRGNDAAWHIRKTQSKRTRDASKQK
jgi:hypothetical protein